MTSKIILILLCLSVKVYAQNPVVPGYYADPSIRVLDNRFYLYATTDGYGPFGNDGETFVWTSDNLQDWKPEAIKGLPNKTIWAPAIMKGKNNKYYLYCQNSVDYSGYAWVGDSPAGPFVQAGFVGGFDIEPFEDPVSKKVYLVSAGRELFEMDNNVSSPTYLTRVVRKIPLQGSFFDFTEGPYLFYKDGWYYCMWAGGRCWQKSYNVRYAASRNIEGPYVEIKDNLLIQTDEANGIIGPGHHSIAAIDNRYFIFYHRQDNTRVPTCNYRFTCVSEIKLAGDGSVKLAGYVNDLASELKREGKYVNLALHKDVFANSESSSFRAVHAVDGRNDTRWTTGIHESGALSIDLGKIESIDAIEVDFEYLDKYHTFRVETSLDNNHWTTLSDHMDQAIQGYKGMFMEKATSARYIRVTIKNSEDRTASVWEVKVLKLRK